MLCEAAQHGVLPNHQHATVPSSRLWTMLLTCVLWQNLKKDNNYCTTLKLMHSSGDYSIREMKWNQQITTVVFDTVQPFIGELPKLCVKIRPDSWLVCCHSVAYFVVIVNDVTNDNMAAFAHVGAHLGAFFYWTRFLENNVPFDNIPL